MATLKQNWDLFCVFVVSFALFAALVLAVGLPHPRVHDEFVYLMQGQTFALGRLTNPTHPMWRSFETFHTLMQPTYASKYPPLQGAFLALGILVGLPIVGVWLSSALAVAAFYWMARAIVSRSHALIAAAIIHLLLLKASADFWGAAGAALAGALMVGSALRLRQSPTMALGALLGLACWLGGFSRPYESVPVVLGSVFIVAKAWIDRFKHRRQWDPRWTASIIGFSIVSVLGFGFLLYYNYRITGSLWALPYALYDNQYNGVPSFLWQSPGTQPITGVAEIDKFYAEAMRRYQVFAGSWHGKLDRYTFHFVIYSAAYLFVPFCIPLLFIPLYKDKRLMRLFATWTALCVLWLFLCLGAADHYASPMLGIWVCLITLAFSRLLTHSWPWRPTGAVVSVAILLLMAWHVGQTVQWMEYRALPGTLIARDQIAAQLGKPGEKNLVMVSYPPNHNPHLEFVFNDADIDNSPLVWARMRDPDQNQKLVQYFSDRKVWHVEVGSEQVRMRRVVMQDEIPTKRDLSSRQKNDRKH